ncbi:TonB-dependent receptor domain-containing protein [Larkinella soli]|uniref:TonB-dependent receptor domain-containing protein n=1 Tax=Larkinella soli TaxID=1770527 RepID=UPI000FFB2077|nr:TonB-dependent receptor [Larkinella soli]
MSRNLFFSFLLLVGLSTRTVAQAPPAGSPAPSAPAAIPGTAADNQPRGNGKISGILIDSTSKKPVEYATVALLNPQTRKPIDGTTTDDKGKFTLSKLAPGEYRLQYSFMGYQNKESRLLTIEKGTDLNLGSVVLSPDVRTLSEVTVTGQAAMIEEKVDRLVYNADKDLTAKGGDATDIMRKVPMLTVDLDGNVSLRGSQNVRVLINNKPSTIVASSVADALKQIPADMIKTVEVITSPSAKYDAEGSAGIINIITKKNTLQGLTLNLDGGAGTRSSNLGLNGSYRAGKLGFSLGGFGRAFYNKAVLNTNQTTLQNGNTIRTSQNADAFDNGLFGQYTLGFDYDISKNQSLTASARYGIRNFRRDQDLMTQLYTNNLLSSTSLRDVNSKDLSNSVDVNVDYLHTFKPQQEWSVSAQFSKNNLTNNFDADLMTGVGELTGRQRNINLNENQEFTIQTDYQTPLTKNQLLEFGGKGIFRQVNSNFRYLIADPTATAFSEDATRPSGLLDYSQNVAATYVSYTLTTKNKFTFKVGSRYEHTTISANNGENSKIAIPAYSNLVPSVNISKALKGGTTVKIAYNRRIQRPGLQQLNPNFNAANPQSITVGNPVLRPELTDNVELGLSTNIKKTYLNVAVFGRQTANAITQIRQPVDTLVGAIFTTFQNIGKEQALGMNFFGNIAITPKWSVSGGFDGFYAHLQGMTTGLDGTSTPVTNSGFTIGGRLMTQVQLGSGWGLQGFGFGRSPQIQLQGKQGGFRMYSLGVRKDLPNKKGSVGFAAENFIGNGVTIRTESTSPLFTQTSSMRLLNRSFKITFNYKIGKMSFQQPARKKKSVNNDDVKEGGDNRQ